MKNEIVVVTDNTPGNSLAGEWGLSLLVKYNGKKILVDAGASDLFLKNMKGLDEAVEDIDYAVLSHAHYDHANGMASFFDKNDKAKLYIRESVAPDCYAKVLILKKYIGIPRGLMNTNANRVEKVTGNHKLMEGISLIPHTAKNLSAIGKRENMYRKTPSGWVPDDFSHEQSLVIDTDKGLIVINSCSHGGVTNIVEEVKAAFPGRQIYGYIGGLHLFNKTNEEIETTAEELELANLEFICTGHCTGKRALAIFGNKFGDKLMKLHVGLQIDI